MGKLFLTSVPDTAPKQRAFAYQQEAVEAIRDLEYAAVFHEQGLGKTKIAIDVALYWLEKRIVDTVLIVTKKGLVRNWQREFRVHAQVQPQVLSQSHKANFELLNSPVRAVLAHYEVLVSERERLKLFLKARDVGVILDESAKIKNPDATVTQAAFDLSTLFKRRIIMTGTPVANRPHDIWGQICFLDQGKALGGDFDSFKAEVDLSPDLADDAKGQREFELNLCRIFDKISAFSVRETKQSGVIELPQKVISTAAATWEPAQHGLYCRYRDELRAIVVREGIPTEDMAESVLKRLLRLVQVASNPRLVDQGYPAEPGKFPVLMDLIQRITDKHQKVIVWSAFNENVDWLATELKAFGARRVHGQMDMEQRNRSIDKFLTDPGVQILVATPGAAKEGLTLTVANHVIFYDRSFSLDDYLQAQDRIHRISQKQTCYVHNIIMEDSIDEWVDQLLRMKHLAAQLTQGDISLEYYRAQVSYDFGTVLREMLGLTS